MKSDSIIYDTDAVNSVWQRVIGADHQKSAPDTHDVHYFLRRETELLRLFFNAFKISSGKMRILFSSLINNSTSRCRALTLHYFIHTGETFSAKKSPPIFSLSCALRTAYKTELELCRDYMNASELQDDKTLSELYVNLSRQSEQSAKRILKAMDAILGHTF